MKTKSPTVSITPDWIWRALTGLPPEFEPLHWHVVNYVRDSTNDTFEPPLSDITSKFGCVPATDLHQTIDAAVLSAASHKRWWIEQKDLAFLEN